MTNKKSQAGEQLMYIIFIFLLLVIASGISLGIYIFYKTEYDFRQVDADLLNYKLNKCINEKEINWQLESGPLIREILRKCALNEKVLNQFETFVILIKYNDLIKFDLGNEVNCGLSNKVLSNNLYYPKCSRSEVSKTINGEIIEFKILTGSAQRRKEGPIL